MQVMKPARFPAAALALALVGVAAAIGSSPLIWWVFGAVVLISAWAVGQSRS